MSLVLLAKSDADRNEQNFSATTLHLTLSPPLLGYQWNQGDLVIVLAQTVVKCTTTQGTIVTLSDTKISEQLFPSVTCQRHLQKVLFVSWLCLLLGNSRRHAVTQLRQKPVAPAVKTTTLDQPPVEATRGPPPPVNYAKHRKGHTDFKVKWKGVVLGETAVLFFLFVKSQTNHI